MQKLTTIQVPLDAICLDTLRIKAMTTLKQEIIRLKAAKFEIKDALVAKGISIEDEE